MRTVLIICGLITLAASVAPAADPTNHYRVSALAGNETEFRIGLVDLESGNAYLLRPGDKLDGFELVKPAANNETIILRKDGQSYELRLEGDPNAADLRAPDESENATIPPPIHSKSLEEFLAEYPEARATEGVWLKIPHPPALIGPGRGPGIEGQARIQPPSPTPTNDMHAGGPAQTTAEALRRMAESVGQPPPDIPDQPTTFEDFQRQHPELR